MHCGMQGVGTLTIHGMPAQLLTTMIARTLRAEHGWMRTRPATLARNRPSEIAGAVLRACSGARLLQIRNFPRTWSNPARRNNCLATRYSS